MVNLSGWLVDKMLDISEFEHCTVGAFINSKTAALRGFRLL